MAFSEFDIHTHMFTFSRLFTSIRHVRTLFYSLLPARLTLGFLSGGLLYPKIPQVVLKKRSIALLPPPFGGTGHHSRRHPPNTTDLPGADQPGSAEYEHEDEAEDGFGHGP